MWAYWQEKDKGVASADEALQHECKTEKKWMDVGVVTLYHVQFFNISEDAGNKFP